MTQDAVAELPLVRKKHYGQWLSALIVLLLLAVVVKAFADGQIAWAVVRRYLFAPSILEGLRNTILMAVSAKALGIVIGVVLAVMISSPNRVVAWSSRAYIWFFRGTPLLLQLLIWFNLALVFPTIGWHGIVEFKTVDVMTPFVATLLGLSINQGAYTAEVVRGGLLSVDHGQTEAAKAIGMTNLVALRRIVLPQAMKAIIPPLGNETISMVKVTAIASVIQYPEILRNAEAIYHANAQVIELLMVAAFWYLAAVTMLTIGQHYLERHFARGSHRAPATASAKHARVRGAPA